MFIRLLDICSVTQFHKSFNMEKSMVNELYRLKNSQFIGTRSTFITTSLNEGDTDMKKSKIQNLPSYRKEDLSSRMPFVVVFQTIQIQRLSTEIETLRVSLKDLQRQAFNASNYEIQIRQLNEKCYGYNQEIYEYRNEVDKLNMICEKLYSQLENFRTKYAKIDPTIQEKYRLQKNRTKTLEEEIEKWKARVNALEISKNKQLDDMRLMMESQRKSMIDREIKELKLKHDSQIQLLENQIRKSRQSIGSKQADIGNLRSHITRLQIMNEEMRQYQETIFEYQNKFGEISQETLRLNDLLKKKDQEIEKLTFNQQKYLKKIKQLEKLLEEASNKEKIISKYEKQLEIWKTKFSKLSNQNKQYQDQLTQIPKVKAMMKKISSQSDDLKENQKKKIMEMQSWKNKCHQLENVQKEKQTFQKKKLPMLEEKISQLINENDRLNGILRSRIGELQKQKSKNTEMQKSINKYMMIEKEKNQLQKQINNHVRMMDQLKSKIKKLQDQNKKLPDLQNKIRNSQKEKNQFIQQVDRLNSAVKGLNNEKDNLQKKNKKLQQTLSTFNNIEEELKAHRHKEINLTKQIDRINGILNEKIKQIQKLKDYFAKLQSNLGHYQKLQKKMLENVRQTQKLAEDLDKARKQATHYQQKAISAESTINNLKNQILTINQEKDHTIRLINRKTQELDHSLAENHELKMENQHLKKFEPLYKQINQKYRTIEQKYAEQQKKLMNENNKNTDLNKKLEKAMSQLNHIKREGIMSPQFKQQFHSLKMQCEKREKEIRNLQQRFFTIESLFRKAKSMISQNEQVNKRNHQKWNNLNQKIDQATQFMRRMFDIQSQLWKIKEQNINLQTKAKIMNYELEAENMKKSLLVNNSFNHSPQFFPDIEYRKVQSTYLDHSDSKDLTSRTGFSPSPSPYRQQHKSHYNFNLT